MNTAIIIRHCEKLWTLTKRPGLSDDRDARRADIVAQFEAMCTDLGKIATKLIGRDWDHVHERVHFLHTEAVWAEERRVGTFTQVGSETALVTSLHSLAAVMGFTLADAATAATAAEDGAIRERDDRAAMAAVEHREAAE